MKHMKLIYNNQLILLPLMLTLNIIYHFQSKQSRVSKLEFSVSFRLIKIILLSYLQCLYIELYDFKNRNESTHYDDFSYYLIL